MINLPNQYYGIDPRIQFLISNISIYISKLLEISIKKDSGEKIKKVDVSNLLNSLLECTNTLSNILEIDEKKFIQVNNSIENTTLEKMDNSSMISFVIMMAMISGKLLEAENNFHFAECNKTKLSESIIEELIYINLIIKRIKKVFGF